MQQRYTLVLDFLKEMTGRPDLFDNIRFVSEDPKTTFLKEIGLYDDPFCRTHFPHYYEKDNAVFHAHANGTLYIRDDDLWKKGDAEAFCRLAGLTLSAVALRLAAQEIGGHTEGSSAGLIGRKCRELGLSSERMGPDGPCRPGDRFKKRCAQAYESFRERWERNGAVSDTSVEGNRDE